MAEELKYGRRPSTEGGVVGLIIFGLFWSGMTLLFDGLYIRNALHQLRTLTYSTTQGAVTETDLECVPDNEGGSSYRPIIRYSYSVAGKEFKGDRRRYDESSFGPRTAQRIVDAYPVGRSVEVYYAVHNPADAVLRRGLEGIDLFNAMFMLPFNLVMAGLIVRLWNRLCRPHARGTKSFLDDDGPQGQWSSWPPLNTGVAVAGALAFGGVFIVGIGFGSNPSMPVMLTTLAVIIGGGLLACLYHRARLGADA